MPAPRGAFAQVGSAAVFAGQKTTRQAKKIDHAQALRAAQRLQLGLVGGAAQRLQALITRQAQAGAGGQGPGQARGGEVAVADGARLNELSSDARGSGHCVK